MASGSSPDSGRRTWISSLELHRLCSSGQSPSSPDAAAVLSLAPSSPLTEDTNWFKKVPCCHLKSSEDGGKGQGIIVCLGIDSNQQRLSEILGVSTYPALALLTNHHIIPSKSAAKKWKLSIHGMEMKKLIVGLDEKRIDVCKSCCGRDGVLGHSEHSRAPCPFRADFTILVLSKDFSSELLKNREFKFPILAQLDVESLKNALQSERFYIFKRDEETGVVRDVELTLHKVQAPTSDDELSLDGQITAYKQMCLLRYDINVGVSRGDSGAGIFFKRGSERLLLGLHKSTEEDEGYHSGIAIHAIFHAITGSEVCRLIPALSLLKDGKMYNHLQRSLYRNVCVCFEVKEGAGVQVSDDRRGELTLEKTVHILDYVLKEQLLVLQKGEELTQPSLDLLTSIFNYCSQFDHGTIKDRVRAIFQDERTRGNFYESVCKAGEQVCRLCDANERTDIVESCFVCWQKLSNFPFPRPVFSESSKFANIKLVRDSKQFQDNLIVQKAFGDICLGYQLHMRCELQLEKDQFHVEIQQQRENFEQERELYEQRVKEALQEREKKETELKAEVEEERRKKEQEIDTLKGDFDAEREDLKEKLRNAEQSMVERNLALEQLEQVVSESNKRADELESKLDQVERDKSQLNAENEKLAKQLGCQTPERSSPPPGRHYSEPLLIRPRPSLYPTRRVTQEDNTFEHFWNRDIAEVLNRDVALREKLAKYFVKNTGSKGGRTWEHLLDHLHRTKRGQNFHMDAEELETRPVAEILLSIILEWSKVGEKVTVQEFCEVSKELGIGRVGHILREAERTAYDTPGDSNGSLFLDCHGSDEAQV